MKKIVSLILILVMILSICGCSFGPSTNNTETTVPSTETPTYNDETTAPGADVTEPDVTEPDVTEPDVTEPDVTEPDVTETDVTEPVVTEPEVTEPEVTEPEVTEPVVTEPEVTEPEVTEPEVTTGFRVGYGRVDITPTESVPLAGFGSTSNRMSNNILSKLYATCIAITDENDNTILLFAMDLQRASSKYVDSARSRISQTTGVPTDQIYISASHTHCAPDVDNTAEPSIIRYNSSLISKMVTAAQTAMNDRKAATMSMGSIETQNLNIVKHYKYTDTDGTVKYFGDNFGTTTINSTTTYATKVDPTMHLVRFCRDGGNDIVMANWRAHPHFHSGSTKYDVSADFVGSFRTAFEQQTGYHFAYFQGAAGNLNSGNKDRIKANIRTSDCDEFGRLLTGYAVDCLKNNMTAVTNTTIQCSQTIMKAEVDHSTDYLVDVAKTLTGSNFTKNNPYGIRSKYHASAIVSRSKLGATINLELNAVAIGDAFAFVTAPDELFDTNSVWLEENSPYAMTFTLELTNGHQGYIPSAEGFAYTCYESDTTKVVAGTGEKVQETFLGMLQAMRTGNSSNSGNSGNSGNSSNSGSSGSSGSSGNTGTTPSTPQVESHTDHCVCCGNTPIAAAGHTCDADTPVWAAWYNPYSMPTSGKYYLTCDITITSTGTASGSESVITNISGDLTLCLNGYSVDVGSGIRFNGLYQNITVNICDCKGTGAINTARRNNSLVQLFYTRAAYDGVATSHTINIWSGNFVGSKYCSTGGIFAINGTHTLNIYGGTLTGGTAIGKPTVYPHGSAIYLQSGATCNMYGGTITGGTTVVQVAIPEYLGGKGGHIYINNGTLNMYGGTISGGKVTTTDSNYPGQGGNIYVTGSGVLNLRGGTITDGEAAKGPNIMVTDGGSINIYDVAVTTGFTAEDTATVDYSSAGSSVTVAKDGIEYTVTKAA